MAIKRYLYPPEGTNIPKLTQLFAVVGLDATVPATPVLTKLAGFGLTVTRTNTGLYAVTLDDAQTVYQVVSADVKFAPTAGDYDPTLFSQPTVLSISQTGFTFGVVKPSILVKAGSVGDFTTGGKLLVGVWAQNSGVKA